MTFPAENFARDLRNAIDRKAAGSQCCICYYRKHVNIIHVDGKHRNGHISNIATLCPNHTKEVESGEFLNTHLFSIWWSIREDGVRGKTMTNHTERLLPT
jgi:hypothetical protein